MNDALLNNVLRHSDNCCLDLDQWLACHGGDALEQALGDPASVPPLIKEAGLRGLGGSGFPTWKKWEMIAAQPEHGPRYLVCNGNEDEPGTFKDRLLLEASPHQVIEGALITALATKCNRIILYLNPHLEKAIKATTKAVAQWQQSDYLQRLSDALDSPVELSIVRTPGLYIAGEETAAISAIDGGFPFPRSKPPYPAVAGINGQPTLINNIETLANVSHIVRNGAEWFHNLGLGSASGTKIYCVSGDVIKPDAYELPMGISLRSLLYDYAGGITEGRQVKAVFTGGPSHAIVAGEMLDIALDFDSTREQQTGLGTGAMIVVAEGDEITPHVARFLEFFAASSCGQCPPCTNGTADLARLSRKIADGEGRQQEFDQLNGLCEMLPGSGRCHLVDGAVTVLKSSLHHFPHEWNSRLRKR